MRYLPFYLFILALTIQDAGRAAGFQGATPSTGTRTSSVLKFRHSQHSPLAFGIKPPSFVDLDASRIRMHSDLSGLGAPDASEETWPVVTDSINYGRLALLGGLMVGSIVTIHLYQQAGWWADNRSPFHFQEDLTYGRSVDKIGHFFGATAFTFVMRRALEGANLPRGKALWIGASGALLFQTYVEIEDGFSTWGFDRVDWLSDLGGSAWPVLQNEIPVLRNYNLKFSYIPSNLLDRPGGTGFKGQKHLIIDDYEGQTFWLSVKMKNVLPVSLANYWPSFLCLAAGYGARDIAGINSNPYSVVFLTVDYDFAEIIPQTSTFLKDMTEALNFIHFPAPAVRISPTAIWYGLYF